MKPMGRSMRSGLLVLVLGIAGLHSVAYAGLFDDEEARKAILDLRQRVEAGRQASEASLQRLMDSLRESVRESLRESQNEQLRRSSEESAQFRRGLLELQNQIEGLRSEVARLNGQNEQTQRAISELQLRQKDLALGQRDLALGQQDLASGETGRLEQLVEEPRQVIDLPLDDVVYPSDRRISRGLSAQDGQRIADRREGIAQLVRQHREELLFVPIGVLGDFGCHLGLKRGEHQLLVRLA